MLSRAISPSGAPSSARQWLIMRLPTLVGGISFSWKENRVSNRQLEERDERRFAEWVAECLDLTIEELDQTEWEHDEETLHGGGAINTRIIFDLSSSDQEVLAKLGSRLDGDSAYIGIYPGEPEDNDDDE